MMELEETLLWAFIQNYHFDMANSAVHCAQVRWSPLTFRLAEAIEGERARIGSPAPSEKVLPQVYAVLLDKGLYEEDRGR